MKDNWLLIFMIHLAKCTCSSNQTKIKVSGIESSVEEEDLENIFENEKKQGGGCVKKVTIFPDKACAIVEFEESEAVEKVLNKRPIKIKKKDVDVELYHTQHTIQLNGHLQECTLHQIRTCLEDHYGETVCIALSSREHDTIFVTFKDEEVAKDVVIQGHLEIENETFSVVFHDPIMEMHGDFIVDNSELDNNAKCTCSSNQTKIKVSGIESSVEEEDLENIFENEKKQGGGCVKKVTIFPDKACAIVEFEESEAVEKVLNKRPIKIKKKDVDVELYHTQHTIQLNGHLQECTLDQIRTCLEDHYGETVCIALSSREHDTIFVTFKDEEVAKDVVIQGHLEIENETFSVVFHDPIMEMHGDFIVDNSELDNDDDGTSGQDEDKLYKYEKFIESLGLMGYYPNKISISRVMSIDMEEIYMQDSGQKRMVTLNELPWILLRRLLGVNCKSRDRVVSLISESSEITKSHGQFTNEFFNVFEDNNKDARINPLDLFITVYKCCDPMLQQLLFQKCYSCKIAVPFIYVHHNFSDSVSKPIVSVWPLRRLSIQNKYTDNEGKTKLSVEEGIYELPTNFVTFARIGQPTHSKSEMLNYLLSEDSCKTFFDRNSSKKITSHEFINELVEIFWLPKAGSSKNIFINPITFLNCRGSLHQFQNETLKFISKLTDILVVLLDIKSIHKTAKYTDERLSMFSDVIIVVDNPMERKKFEPIMKEFCSSIERKGIRCQMCSTYQGTRKLNPIEMTSNLLDQLQTLVNKVPLSLESRIKDCSKNIEFDEENLFCIKGKLLAEEIMCSISSAGDQMTLKTIITPVQTSILNRIGPLIKQQQRLQYETEIKKIESELFSLREKVIENITPTVQIFAKNLCLTQESDLSLHFFLGWLNILIEKKMRSMSYKFHQEKSVAIGKLKQRDKTSVNIKDELDRLNKDTEDKIEKSSFSIEYLFREISHIYNVLLILRKRKSCLPEIENMIDILSKLIKNGYTFELVDGDNFVLPICWAEKVLESLSKKINYEKVLTLSVLGLQSSGKSTLLNTMFGSHFATSSGRCTKGLNMQLISVSQVHAKRCGFGYVLVIDTEGLRAAELYDQKYTHDNELATFITGLGDVSILNVMGENICEINDILNVTVHAFIRLKKANKSLDIRKLCYFVHQNVSEILTAGKTKPGLRKLVEKLNLVTKEAAQLENIANLDKFHEIIDFDINSHVFYMPTLWQGIRPMTFVNSEYSEQVDYVKTMVLKGACAIENKSYKSLKDLITHIKDLWKGVLAEDFVFSFRNNLEIKAYLHLNEKFKKKQTDIECKMFDKCCSFAKISFSKSINQEDLDINLQTVKNESDKMIEIEEETWKNEMEDFINNGVYPEILVQWKETTKNQISTTCNDLKGMIRLDISSLYEDRGVEILTTMDKKHEDDLFERSWNLAKELKGNFSEQETNEQFEKIWGDISSQSRISQTCNINRNIDIKKEIYNRLNIIFVQNKPILKHCFDARSEWPMIGQLKGSFPHLRLEKVDIKTNKSNPVYKLYRHFRFGKTDKIEMIRTNTEKLLNEIDNTLREQQKNKNRITVPRIHHFFQEVERHYHNFEKQCAEQFTFEISLKVKIYVKVADCAEKVFKGHMQEYEKKYGPEARREKYKQKMKNIFNSLIQDRKAEETAASEFCSSVCSSIQDAVIKFLSINVKTALRSKIGSMKYHFITNLLSDLLRENKYELFSEYNRNPSSFAAKWITKESNRYLFCQPSNKYYTMARSSIMKHFEEVKESITKTVEHFSGEPPTSDEWIDTLSSLLEKCTLSDSQFNLLKNILRQKVDFQNLRYLIFRNLDKSEKKLTEHFKSVDDTSVIWNLPERLNPITEIIKETWGCSAECPFCGEPCARDIHDAEKIAHFCIQHKPKGCKAIHLTSSKELSISTCNFAVNSKDLTHSCGVFNFACRTDSAKSNCPDKEHRYRDYKMFLKSWDIEPNADLNDVCKFWMYYLGKFAEDIVKDTEIDISHIPETWQNISDEDAITSLTKLYGV